MHRDIEFNRIVYIIIAIELNRETSADSHPYELYHHVVGSKDFRASCSRGTLDLHLRISVSVPVAQWLDHCVSSAKVVGSIPREHTY